MPARGYPSIGVYESQSASAVIPDLTEELEAWIKEFSAVRRNDPGATLAEIAEAAGVNRRTAGRIVQRGVAEGKYTAGLAFRQNSLGRMKRVPVYQIVNQEES